MRNAVRMMLLVGLLAAFSYVLARASLFQDMKEELQASLANIDSRIESTIGLLDALPRHDGCEAEHKRYYNSVSYTEEEVRALGYIKERETGWYACSIFGETQSTLAHWDGSTNAKGIFIGWSLLTNYFPEPSFVIAKRESDTKYFAYVNPRRVVGHWLERPSRHYNYHVFLLGEKTPRYTSEHGDISSDYWSERIIEQRAPSKLYPYELKLSAEREALAWRALTYALRGGLLLVVVWWLLLLVRKAIKPVARHQSVDTTD